MSSCTGLNSREQRSVRAVNQSMTKWTVREVTQLLQVFCANRYCRCFVLIDTTGVLC